MCIRVFLFYFAILRHSRIKEQIRKNNKYLLFSFLKGIYHLVNDVTEECTNNAHTIQDVISVDQFNNIADDKDLATLRYGYGTFTFKSCYDSSDTLLNVLMS